MLSSAESVSVERRPPLVLLEDMSNYNVDAVEHLSDADGARLTAAPGVLVRPL